MNQSVRRFRPLLSFLAPGLVLCSGAMALAQADDQVDFEKQIKPILEQTCVRCHGPEKTEGSYRMDTRELLIQGGDSGEALVPESADDSHLFYRITLPHDDPTIMPAEGDPLSEEQIELIRNWIDQGAKWPEQLVLVVPQSQIPKKLTEEDLGVEITAAEEEAIKKAQELQALAMRIAQNTNWLRVDFSLGSKELAGDQLTVLKDMNNLYELDLGGTPITDEGLEHVKSLTNLRRLHLEKTNVTDAGLAHLAELQNLQYLNLYGTQVTDAGLEHLKKLKNLQKVYLWQTKVTPEGAEQLQAALPELQVNLGLETTAVIAQAETEEEAKTDEAEKAEDKPAEDKDAEKDKAKEDRPKEDKAEEKPKEEKPKEKKEEEKDEQPEEKKPADEKPEAEKQEEPKEAEDKEEEEDKEE